MSLLRSADVKINVQAVFLFWAVCILYFIFNLIFPLHFFLLLCQFLTHPDCTFATELTIILSIIKVWMQEEGGSGVPEM